jgi:hypothetical protein
MKGLILFRALRPVPIAADAVASSHIVVPLHPVQRGPEPAAVWDQSPVNSDRDGLNASSTSTAQRELTYDYTPLPPPKQPSPPQSPQQLSPVLPMPLGDASSQLNAASAKPATTAASPGKLTAASQQQQQQQAQQGLSTPLPNGASATAAVNGPLHHAEDDVYAQSGVSGMGYGRGAPSLGGASSGAVAGVVSRSRASSVTSVPSVPGKGAGPSVVPRYLALGPGSAQPTGAGAAGPSDTHIGASLARPQLGGGGSGGVGSRAAAFMSGPRKPLAGPGGAGSNGAPLTLAKVDVPGRPGNVSGGAAPGVVAAPGSASRPPSRWPVPNTNKPVAQRGGGR